MKIVIQWVRRVPWIVCCFKSETIDFKSVEIHPNHQMPFTYHYTKRGAYSIEQLNAIKPALEKAANIVQNAYQFDRDISVQIKIEDLSRDGGGVRAIATSTTDATCGINHAYYPPALAKFNFGEVIGT